MKNKYNVARDALRELEPLFQGFDCYRREHPGEAASLLSRHGYSYDDVVIWGYADTDNFPTEAVLKEMYDFCVKNGKAETNGVVFTKGSDCTRVSASDVNTLIKNYVCTFNDIRESDDMITSFTHDRSPASVKMELV